MLAVKIMTSSLHAASGARNIEQRPADRLENVADLLGRRYGRRR
jgi:hypothetical protein